VGGKNEREKVQHRGPSEGEDRERKSPRKAVRDKTNRCGEKRKSEAGKRSKNKEGGGNKHAKVPHDSGGDQPSPLFFAAPKKAAGDADDAARKIKGKNSMRQERHKTISASQQNGNMRTLENSGDEHSNLCGNFRGKACATEKERGKKQKIWQGGTTRLRTLSSAGAWKEAAKEVRKEAGEKVSILKRERKSRAQLHCGPLANGNGTKFGSGARSGIQKGRGIGEDTKTEKRRMVRTERETGNNWVAIGGSANSNNSRGEY